MTTPRSAALLALSLSTFALVGAPCPLGGEEVECESDNDCDDDEECNSGECEREEDENSDPPEGDLTAKQRQLCLRQAACAGDEDPAATCDAQAEQAETDELTICLIAACAPEMEALMDCSIANGECVDGTYDFGFEGPCEGTLDPYLNCYEESGCTPSGEGEGEGEGEGVCAGFIGVGDGCDCGCGEHDPDCDSVGGGCDTAGCCVDPPQNGCEFCN